MAGEDPCASGRELTLPEEDTPVRLRGRRCALGSRWLRHDGAHGEALRPSSPRSSRSNNLRATEYSNFLGEQRAPRGFQRGAMSLTPSFVVLRGPPAALRVLRGEKAVRTSRCPGDNCRSSCPINREMSIAKIGRPWITATWQSRTVVGVKSLIINSLPETDYSFRSSTKGASSGDYISFTAS